MLLIAIFNGTLRDLGYKKWMGDLAAHQLSTVTLMVFFAFYIRFVVLRFPPASEVQALAIGLFWVALTLAFEFGFGRYRGHPWAELFADYNLLRGRLWVLIPVWVGIAPYLFHKLMQR
ncbi:MAG: hypothetical protein EOO15_04925 [Chitinophagaceae bacterium]|nr:MAG: hypothetical protein EOO15_04925 [Chitinophagaceae bacterium]